MRVTRENGLDHICAHFGIADPFKVAESFELGECSAKYSFVDISGVELLML